MTTARRYEAGIQTVPGDDASLEDLCKPLSGRVMPRSALVGAFGEQLDAGRVMAKARATSTPSPRSQAAVKHR